MGHKPARRRFAAFLSTCLLIPTILLIYLSGRLILAGIYTNVSHEPAYINTPVQLAAQRAAVDLSPWHSKSHSELARSLYISTQDNAAVAAEFSDALNWAAADAYVWQTYAGILAAQNNWGDDFELAVYQSNQLAPTNPSIQRSNAMLGVRYWFQGSPSVQRQWLQSMSYELRTNKKWFLWAIYRSDSMYWFCASPALDLPLEDWCKIVWEGRLPPPRVTRKSAR